MFNKRWKKVLAWSLSLVLVLAIGGLFAANYAIDKLMTSMAEGIDLDSDNAFGIEAVSEAIPTFTAMPTEAEDSDISTNENSNNNVDTPAETAISQSTPQIAEENKQPVEKKSSKNNDKQPSKVIPNPTNSPSSEENNNIEGYSAQVSADKAKNIQENVTVKEKADVASIVLGQLSASDIKRLQQLSNGGLTSEEKAEARRIILGKVSPEQYNELSQIAKKYGVSRGLTYEQAQAEDKGSE